MAVCVLLQIFCESSDCQIPNSFSLEKYSLTCISCTVHMSQIMPSLEYSFYILVRGYKSFQNSQVTQFYLEGSNPNHQYSRTFHNIFLAQYIAVQNICVTTVDIFLNYVHMNLLKQLSSVHCSSSTAQNHSVCRIFLTQTIQNLEFATSDVLLSPIFLYILLFKHGNQIFGLLDFCLRGLNLIKKCSFIFSS